MVLSVGSGFGRSFAECSPTPGCLEGAVAVVAAAVAVASSGLHHPCVAGNSLPFWVLMWQRHAPTKRSSD